MAQTSNSSRKGGQQPPLEIVLDEVSSIVCDIDDVPSNCTIRVTHTERNYSPQVNPNSKWTDASASPPPSHMRSRRSMVESVRRNMEANYGGTSSSGADRARGAEQDAFRQNYSKHESRSPSPTPSVTSASSDSSSASRPSPSPSQGSAVDRLLNSNRAQKNFRRANIAVDSTDLHEMHSNAGSSSGSRPQTPSSSTSIPQGDRPSPPSPAGIPQGGGPSPPPPAKGGRCCRMGECNPGNDREPAGGGSPTSSLPSKGASGGATCSYHGSEPCPARAGAYCRANRTGQKGGPAARSPGGHCKYHDQLPCPALAGVPCRGERQAGGSSSPSPSRSPSPSPGGSSSPRYSGPRTGSSPSKSAGVCYPPRSISPPPKSPRSRTPAQRRAPRRKSKGNTSLLLQPKGTWGASGDEARLLLLCRLQGPDTFEMDP